MLKIANNFLQNLNTVELYYENLHIIFDESNIVFN